MIPDELLRAIRNDLPIKVTILRLGRQGPPSKYSEGYFRFPCPACGELRATVNPGNTWLTVSLVNRTSTISTC